MATGFKTATVTSGDVPSTQTNFPSYVDLSRLGITTQAEADSVRVYADSSKTTEWAREIVSITEMHVKVPSLTSTVDIYVDWDGSRADYGVATTYGRNAVWTNYDGVYHMNDANDSSAKGYNLSNRNSVGFVAGKIGNASDAGSGNGSADAADMKALYSNVDDVPLHGLLRTNYTVQMWSYYYNLDGCWDWSIEDSTSNGESCRGGDVSFHPSAGTGVSMSNITTSTWQMKHMRSNGTNVSAFVNAVSQGSESFLLSTTGSRSGLVLHAHDNANIREACSSKIDEVRFCKNYLSTDWITTEYNNQNDEETFWGTWSDVSAGTTFIPTITIF